jgi:hypothetical protein
MFAFTLLFAGSIYMLYILPGKKSLHKIEGLLKGITSQADFSTRFNDVDSVFSKTKPLKHCWEEFCETLIKPDQQSQSQIIRNTIRPNFYLNIHAIESNLHLKLLHFVSNILVGVGLLLTFIGLVAALTFAMCGISDQVIGALAQICPHTVGVNPLEKAIKDLLHAACSEILDLSGRTELLYPS